MISDVNRLVGDFTALLQNGLLPLFGLAFILLIWMKSKSAVAALVAAVMAAAIWWFASNMEAVRDKVDEDLVQSAAVVQVDGPDADGGRP
ncbi:hypothetical protein [Streptomyces sp. SM12]|uniref:hypothetical protein n=1 Tax=Streptomyces sp. SM12 TaxID=1071602 RepID=UPI000CD5449E|nr:hypothetical protein [Streptomyces sp. SM12]